jgi:hypothetical protein
MMHDDIVYGSPGPVRVYRIYAFVKIFASILALPLIVFFSWMLIEHILLGSTGEKVSEFMPVIDVSAIFFGLCILIAAFRYRIELYPHKIRSVSLFGSKELHLHEIKGFSAVHNIWILVYPRNPAAADITIGDLIKNREDIEKWIRKNLTDLNAVAHDYQTDKIVKSNTGNHNHDTEGITKSDSTNLNDQTRRMINDKVLIFPCIIFVVIWFFDENFCTFLPYPDTINLLVGIIIIAVMASTVYFYRKPFIRSNMLWKRIFAPMILSLIFSFKITGSTLPWIYTNITGYEGYILAKVTGTAGGGYKNSCPKPLVNNIVVFSPPQGMCINDHDALKFTNGKVLRLKGKKSALGINVEEMNIVYDVQH